MALVARQKRTDSIHAARHLAADRVGRLSSDPSPRVDWPRSGPDAQPDGPGHRDRLAAHHDRPYERHFRRPRVRRAGVRVCAAWQTAEDSCWRRVCGSDLLRLPCLPRKASNGWFPGNGLRGRRPLPLPRSASNGRFPGTGGHMLTLDPEFSGSSESIPPRRYDCRETRPMDSFLATACGDAGRYRCWCRVCGPDLRG